MDGQDWAPTTIVNPAAKAAAKAKTAPARVAPEVAQARKLASAEAPVKLKTLTAESRQIMVQLRVNMEKNQTQLNQLCNFPPNTIREIEAGRLAPSIQQLNTLNRVLKTGLKLG